jgi:hypothetical protein
MNPGAQQASSIRALNDTFRSTFIGGRVLITEGVRALGQEFESACVEAVQTHRDFTGDNDPYGEHDFGSARIDGTKVFWKIDYYDRDCHYGSENPADPTETTRVLTIMLASEY